MTATSSDIMTSPVFIVGCGRSGTSLLGAALSQHPGVTYLRERRDLWFAAYPEADIWTENASVRNGRMVLTAADEHPDKSSRLRHLFLEEANKSRGFLLLEKLPINNFRLGLINAIFPAARFIHIYRNGLEVARSIEERIANGKWFGVNDYKWKELVRFASGAEETAALPSLCADNYDRGLLEWRLSTGAVGSFLKTSLEERYCELSYGMLVDDPVGTLQYVQTFIGIAPHENVLTFGRSTIERRTVRLDGATTTYRENLLGGELLQRSLEVDDGKLTIGSRRRSRFT